MRSVLFLLFLVVISADVYAVMSATGYSQSLSDDKVSCMRESSSAEEYDYFVFTNKNEYDVIVTYVIEGYAPTKIALKAGESKKTASAYKNSLKIQMSIERMSQKNKIKHRKLNESVKSGKSM